MVGEHSHGIMRHLHNVHIMWVLGNKNIHVGTYVPGPLEACEGWGGHQSIINRAVVTNLQAVRLIQFQESWHVKRTEVGGSGGIPPRKFECCPRLPTLVL